MQIEAVYHKDQNRFVLLQPVQIKKARSQVTLEFPDEDIVAPGVDRNVSDSELETDQILEEIQAVLGPDWEYVADDRTDEERFADELKYSGKYSV